MSKLGALPSFISLMAAAISLLVKEREYCVLGGHEVLTYANSCFAFMVWDARYGKLCYSGNWKFRFIVVCIVAIQFAWEVPSFSARSVKINVSTSIQPAFASSSCILSLQPGTYSLRNPHGMILIAVLKTQIYRSYCVYVESSLGCQWNEHSPLF